jgi:hypothetical protein
MPRSGAPTASAVSNLRAAYRSAGRDLAARLAGLPEPGMRMAAVVDALRRPGAVRAVWILESLIRGAIARDENCLKAYDSLVDPTPYSEQVPREAYEEMVEAGIEEGCVAALQWLRTQVYHDPAARAVDPSRLIAWGLRDMTLGDRRALARRAKGDTLNELACDPDPGVITNLLNNPRVTEPVVLILCARRPTVPEPLATVVRSPRWIQRYRVKLALVRNPYLEVRFGLNLLVYLNRVDLHDVRDDESLSPRLRLGAQRLCDLVPSS